MSEMSDWSVLALTRHVADAASSRLRTFQYLPWLEQAGASVDVRPFFDREYLHALYATGGRSRLTVARAYARRMSALLSAHHYDVVWVEKELLPFMPASAEKILSWQRVPYVLDYDDASFHTYDEHPNRWVRRVLGNKLDPLVRRAAAVCVGNPYLAAYMTAHGARVVHEIPTVVDLNRYVVAPPPDGEFFRIGWIGTPATTKYLSGVIDVLREVQKVLALKLVTIGASPLGEIGLPLEQHPWTEDSEVALLGTVHAGIMPLPDAPWERGKCGYKLIQYMACGRPVIASPVGVNQDLVTPEVGYLARHPDEWRSALFSLATDRAGAQRMGTAGRSRVEQRYALQVTGPKVAALLRCLATERTGVRT